MNGIRERERFEIRRQLHNPGWRSRVARVREIVQDQLQQLRETSDTLRIRDILPRPDLKDLSSVIKKIEAQRSTNNSSYCLYDIDDLIGIKVLCPYIDDVQYIFQSLSSNSNLSLEPSNLTDAYRSRDSGYRGWHFMTTVKGSLVDRYQDLQGIACEVQLKTMLQESWDAMSHDIFYKRQGQVDKTFVGLIKNFSDQLHTLDNQAENIRTAVVKHENTERHEKHVVAESFLTSLPAFTHTLRSLLRDGNAPREVLRRRSNLLNNLESTSMLVEPIERRRKSGTLDVHVCAIAAVVGLKEQGKHYDEWAATVANELIHRRPDDPYSYLSRGWVCWAIDDIEEAIDATLFALRLARKGSQAWNTGLTNVVYWIADMAWMNGSVDSGIVSDSNRYIRQLRGQLANNPGYMDSYGYYQIATGRTKSNINSGLDMVQGAYDSVNSSGNAKLKRMAKKFFDRHQRIAKIRLSYLTP